MSVEIPDEAVTVFVASRYGSTGTGWVKRRESARRDLAAAAPAILESRVEAVAAEFHEDVHPNPSRRRCEDCVRRARKALGLPDTDGGTSA